jgi:hypothetical protein
MPANRLDDRRRLFISLIVTLGGIGDQSAIDVSDEHPFRPLAASLVLLDPIFLETPPKITILQRLLMIDASLLRE